MKLKCFKYIALSAFYLFLAGFISAADHHEEETESFGKSEYRSGFSTHSRGRGRGSFSGGKGEHKETPAEYTARKERIAQEKSKTGFSTHSRGRGRGSFSSGKGEHKETPAEYTARKERIAQEKFEKSRDYAESLGITVRGSMSVDDLEREIKRAKDAERLKRYKENLEDRISKIRSEGRFYRVGPYLPPDVGGSVDREAHRLYAEYVKVEGERRQKAQKEAEGKETPWEYDARKSRERKEAQRPKSSSEIDLLLAHEEFVLHHASESDPERKRIVRSRVNAAQREALRDYMKDGGPLPWD
jgi:hypothetical protein